MSETAKIRVIDGWAYVLAADYELLEQDNLRIAGRIQSALEERDSTLKKIEELTALLGQCHDFLDPYRQTKLRRKVYEAIHEARKSDD